MTLVRNFGFETGALYQATIVNYDGASGNENIGVRGGTITTEGENDNFIGKHLGFDKVKGLWIDNVRLPKIWTNWYGAFRDCEDVQISNLVIGNGVTADMALTESGLQFAGGTRTTVTNCNIFCGDDRIALVHHGNAYPDIKPTSPLSYFTASNCTLQSVRANAIKVETTTPYAGGKLIRRVRFSDIVAKVGFAVGGDTTSFGIRVVDTTTGARLISDVAFVGITLDASGNSTSAGNPLVVKRADRVSFTDLKITGPHKTATIDDANDVLLRDVVIDAPRGDFQRCLWVAGTVSCTNVRIQGGHFRGAEEHGVQLGNGANTVLWFEVSQAVIDGARLSGLRAANATYGRVIGNFIIGSGNWGIVEVAPSANNVYLGNYLPLNTSGPISIAAASSEAIRNVTTFGTPIADTGGFRQTIDGFTIEMQTGVSGVEMDRFGLPPGNVLRFRAPRDGSVTGLSVLAKTACSGGSVTFTVWKNTGAADLNTGGTVSSTGVATGLISTGPTTESFITRAKDSVPFFAGDELYVVMTQSNFMPIPAIIGVTIEVET